MKPLGSCSLFLATSLFGILFFSSCSHFRHHGEGAGHSCKMHGNQKGDPGSCHHEGQCGHHSKTCQKCERPEMCEAHAKKMGMKFPTQAKSTMIPTKGYQAKGEVKLTANEKGLEIEAQLQNLPKGKALGFHIHEFGDCSSGDGKSAGGHFNPLDKPHGAFGEPLSHMGDLGNITSDKSGKVNIKLDFPGARLYGPQSLLGRAFIVHADTDDLKTQPTGNAGARIACGVIGAIAE